MQICRNPVWEFSISEGRLINLGDFAQRLSAIGAQSKLDLSKPLREGLVDLIQTRFSPSAREIAAPLIWPKIQPQFDATSAGYDELSREWSRFEEFRAGSKGGVVDLARARSIAARWGWLSIVVSLGTMTVAVLLKIGGEAEGEARTAFFIALAVSLIIFLFHAAASAELKRGSRQMALARRYGHHEEQALEALERHWEARRGDFDALLIAFDRAAAEASASRSVRKATKYDELVEAEADVLQQAERTNISYTSMMAAQARIAGAITPEERRDADQKYRSEALTWRTRQGMLSEAEARLRLIKIEYEGL